MANSPYAGLDWSATSSFVPSGRGLWDSDADQGRMSQVSQFKPSAENTALLHSLGYSGDPTTQTQDAYDPFSTGGASTGWSPDAMQWLNSQGYQMGVGHIPGSEQGKRGEYWGLLDSGGGYVNGQGTPTTTTPESALPFFALMAAPFAAPLAGAMGHAGAGAIFGGASGAVKGLEGDGNILGNALKGAAIGGASGGITGGLGSGAGQFNVGDALGFTDPNLVKFANSAASTLGKSAITGTNPVQGLIGNALSAGGSALGSAFSAPNAPTLNTPQGGSMNFTDYFKDGNYDFGNMTGLIDAGQLGQIAAPQSDGDWMQNLFQNFNTPNPFLDGSMGQMEGSGGGIMGSVGGFIKNLIGGGGGASGGSGGGMNPLLPLLGGLAGAASSKGSGQTSSVKMDPRMEQYVYGSGVGDPNSFLGAAQKQFQANPNGINPTMQAGLDMQRNALQDPAYAQSFTQMRNMGSGLLNQPMAGNPFTSQPGTMSQAGGAGGLLGTTPQDRAKALMARGRGLI